MATLVVRDRRQKASPESVYGLYVRLRKGLLEYRAEFLYCDWRIVKLIPEHTII